MFLQLFWLFRVSWLNMKRLRVSILPIDKCLSIANYSEHFARLPYHFAGTNLFYCEIRRTVRETTQRITPTRDATRRLLTIRPSCHPSLAVESTQTCTFCLNALKCNYDRAMYFLTLTCWSTLQTEENRSSLSIVLR